MKQITSVDGTPIAYERTGSGPPLVLVHGTTADHTRWEPVRPVFEEQFTVYAIDRRGRGESGDVQQTSSKSAEPTRTFGSGDVTERSSVGQPEASASGDAAEYALEREFEDVAAVVESIDDSVILLGHSYGALCSLEAALRTNNLRALVLYEPPLPVGDHEPFDADVLAEIRAFHDDGEDEQALLLFFREVVKVPTAELEALRDAPNWPARVEAVHTILREEPAAAEYAFDADRFKELTTPTLLLAGSESAPFLKDATDALDDALPNSRIVVFEGHGHAAMTTTPERFIEEVLAFITDPN